MPVIKKRSLTFCACGLAKSPVKIEKAVRVNLDGDGADEVLLLANHSAVNDLSDPQPVGCSMPIMREIVG